MIGQETAAQRGSRILMRGIFFLMGVAMTPAAIFGVVVQHAPGAAVVVLLGLAALALWWLMRRRPASARARAWQRVALLLSVAVAVAVDVAVVLFFASPASGVSAATLMPALASAAVALALLGVRVAVGLELRRMAPELRRPSREPAGGGPTAPAHASSPAATAELRELERRWRQGTYPTGPTLRVGGDGSVALLSDPLRVRSQHLAGMLPLVAVVGIADARLAIEGLPQVAVVLTVAVVLVVAVLAALGRRRDLRFVIARMTGDRIQRRRWRFGRIEEIARADVERAVLVTVDLGATRSVEARWLLLVGAGSRCLMRVDVSSTEPADALLFIAVLGVPGDVRDGVASPEDLRREFPGAASAYYENQTTIGIVLALVIVIVVVVVVVALAGLGVISRS
jgi:hypothetical protein